MKKRKRKKEKPTDRMKKRRVYVSEREEETSRPKRRTIFLHHRRSDVASTNIYRKVSFFLSLFFGWAERSMRRILLDFIQQRTLSSRRWFDHTILIVFFQIKLFFLFFLELKPTTTKFSFDRYIHEALRFNHALAVGHSPHGATVRRFTLVVRCHLRKNLIG